MTHPDKSTDAAAVESRSRAGDRPEGPAGKSVRLLLAAAALVVAAGLLLGFFWWGYWLGKYSLFHYEQEYTWEAAANLFLDEGPVRMLFGLRLWLYLVSAVGFLVCDWVLVSALRARLTREDVTRELFKDAPAFAPFLLLLYFLFVIASGREPTLASLFIFIFALAWHLALQCSALTSAVGATAPGRRRWPRSAWVVVVVVALVTFALFAWMNLRGYQSLRLGYKDSGMFATILHNTLQGRSFFADTIAVPSQHYLGRHFSPGLLVLLPVFWLFPRHETLLVLHALFLASAAIPIYLAARRLSGSGLIGAVLACSYLLAAPLSHTNWGNTYGFQPYSMVVFVVAWTLWAVVTRRWGWLALCVVVGLLLEEQYALILVGLGGWLLVRPVAERGESRRWLGAVLAGLGVVWFLCAVLWWMPWFGGGAVADRYYAYLGETPLEMLSALPKALVRALADWNRWEFLVHMLLPVGFLAVIAPEVLLIGAPIFLAIILADNPAKYSLILGHQGTLLPVVALAAAAGAKRVAERLRLQRLLHLGCSWSVGPATVRYALAVLVIAATAGSGYFFGVSPLSRVYTRATFEVSHRDRLVKQIKALVPQQSSICATFRVASHFAVREHLYLYPLDFDPAGYPENLGDPDYVLLDFTENWTHPGAVVPGRDALWNDPGRRLLFAEEGFLLYGRGPNNRHQVLQDITTTAPRPRRPLNQDCGFGVILVGTDSAIDPTTPDLLRVTYYWLPTQPLARQLFVAASARQGQTPPQRFFHVFANGKVPPAELAVGEVFTQTNALHLSRDVRQVPVEVQVLGLAVVPPVSGPELGTDFRADP